MPIWLSRVLTLKLYNFFPNTTISFLYNQAIFTDVIHVPGFMLDVEETKLNKI